MSKRISFLITHYNRPTQLYRCLETIQDIRTSDDEIIVSDDGSSEESIEKIKNFSFDRLVTSSHNTGLASNINRGINACNGEYILYCQEDFVLQKGLVNQIKYFMDILDSGKLDMVRLKTYLTFPEYKNVNSNIDELPLFTLKNFFKNCHRYSDHPFIVKNVFFDRFGYYMENTSGGYGETEFAIRLNSMRCKIGLSRKSLAFVQSDNISMMDLESVTPRKKRKGNKKLIRFIRSLRLHLEWLLYGYHKRGLLTYKNYRN